jgi:Tol biopolymer transport system component
LIYVKKATLFAIPFDPDTLETRGTAVPVLDDVAYDSRTSTGQFDVSRTGTFVYRRARGDASPLMTVQWVDPTGKKQILRGTPGAYREPSLSPDGTRVALTVGSQDVWVHDQKRDSMTRLTFGGANYSYPTRSPDGKYVVFTSLGIGMFQARADGAGQPQALTQSRTQIRGRSRWTARGSPTTKPRIIRFGRYRWRSRTAN